MPEPIELPAVETARSDQRRTTRTVVGSIAAKEACSENFDIGSGFASTVGKEITARLHYFA
jgi:hypothetical protein